MPNLARPDVDLLDGLSAAIIVDQERMGANARSTVGTATDACALLRIVFSRFGKPSAGPSFQYSFNLPAGACPGCDGRGSVSDIDLDQLFDRSKSLSEGAITIPGYNVDGWQVRIFSESAFFNPGKRIRDYTEEEMQTFLYADPVKVRVASINLTYEGLVPRVRRAFLQKDKEGLQPNIGAFVPSPSAPALSAVGLGSTRQHWPLDVTISYMHGTLLDDCLTIEIPPLAEGRGVGVINAAAVALGLLTEAGPPPSHCPGGRGRDLCGRPPGRQGAQASRCRREPFWPTSTPSSGRAVPRR